MLDHRLNTRTVHMNPVSRFIYWNMNYHVEHHMFPMVPYHALPGLHALIRDDLPAANPSIWHAYREVWPILLRQLRYEDASLVRALPPSARPYRADLHDLVPKASGLPGPTAATRLPTCKETTSSSSASPRTNPGATTF